MKNKIKQNIPNFLLIYYRKVSNYYRLKKLVTNDRKLFFKNASLYSEDGYNERQLKYRLIYAVHGIEKGLSHENLRLGFGKEQLVYIKTLLDEYVRMGITKNCSVYLDTISVLSEYVNVHKEKDYDLSYFNEVYFEFLDEIININSLRTGVLKKIETKDNNKKNFAELSKERFSVRDFSKKEVTNDVIRNVVDIALKTPSACNRQMWTVKAIKDENKIERVLSFQRGFSGYDTPPILFLVTVSLESFQFPRERNQAFVDGGLFSMSLLYSLEYHNLAACALNSELTLEDEKEIREILDIPKSEVMIMFIASGYFKKEYFVCKSPRLDADEVLMIIED
ncbi:nitroreductase family protein [Vagococcus fluvialis]|uniref:nitroreductase family protein n=1 Tax=Vagococcus fluvialis TaxID=2738 RepID=UPI0037D8DC19